jgi:hypothetical protein
MDDRHRASGMTFPNRFARRVLAWGLAVLCALLQPTARADEPRRLEPLPPVTDYSIGSYAPPALLPGVAESQAAPAMLLFGHEANAYGEPYLVQPAAFTEADPAYVAAQPDPPVTLRSNKSLLNFAGMQGAEGDNGSEGGAGPDDGSAENNQAGDGQKKDDEQTYGQAPTDNALQFLRDVDVLLKPGAWQADTGFAYTLFADDFPLPILGPGGEVIDVVAAETRRRLLYTPLAVRYGLRKNIQLFASLPAGFSNTQFSSVDLSVTNNVSGIGDLTAGASFHLMRGEELCPDVIGTFGFTAPTGKFDTPLFGLVPGSNLGQGFWAISGQLLFINRYDPVIVFYGGGYRHLFERRFEVLGLDPFFQPGEQINYMLGVGFSVNDRVTLSTTFQGFYITNTFIDGINVRGSNLEPISLRFAATIVRNCRIIEPFAQIGATESAPRINVGVTVTFY